MAANRHGKKSKGKVLPYTLLNVGPRADPSVQAVSLHVTKSSPAVGCHYFPTGLHFTFVSVPGATPT